MLMQKGKADWNEDLKKLVKMITIYIHVGQCSQMKGNDLRVIAEKKYRKSIKRKSYPFNGDSE